MWKLAALVIGGFAILVGAVLYAGVSPWTALQTLWQGSFGTPAAFAGTLRETTPLLIAGAAVFVALRAGLFNIGVEGQLLVGSAASAAVAAQLHGFLGILLSLIVGCIAGALWALPAAWIRAYRNGHEVISTIMLNNIAVFFTGWLLAGPLRASGQQNATTANLAPDMRIGDIPGLPVHVNWSLAFGILLVAALGVWLTRTVQGYELRAVGMQPSAARVAGINTTGVLMKAMLTSGAIAGFAGAVQVLAYEGRFYAGFSPGYGFDALGVALLAGPSALSVIPASLLFGILAKGGTALQIEGVPKGITTVVLGLLILIAAAVRYRQVKTHA